MDACANEKNMPLMHVVKKYKTTYAIFFKELQNEDARLFLNSNNKIETNEAIISSCNKQTDVFKKYDLNQFMKTSCFTFSDEWFSGKTYHYDSQKVGNPVKSKSSETEWNVSKKEHELYMMLEATISKVKAIEKLSKIIKDTMYDFFIPLFDKSFIWLTQSVVPSKTRYVYPLVICSKMSKDYPPLVYTKELFSQWQNTHNSKLVMVLQKLKLGKLSANYILLDGTIFISFYFDFADANVKSIVLLIQTIKINKYIYDNEEAVFWNWYGGCIPISRECKENVFCDSGLDIFGNGWTCSSLVPIYQGVTGIMYKKLENIDSKIFMYDCFQLEKLVVDHRKESIKVFTQSITSYKKPTKISELLDNLTYQYFLICDVLLLYNINPENFFDTDQHYSRYHFDKHKGMYHTNKVTFENIDEKVLKIIETNKKNKIINIAR